MLCIYSDVMAGDYVLNAGLVAASCGDRGDVFSM